MQLTKHFYAPTWLFPRQAYSFLEVKLRRLRRKTYEGKSDDTRDKNLPTVISNSSNHSTAGPCVTI